MVLGFANLVVGRRAEVLDAVTSIEGGPDLLVRVHESLELAVELDVLAGEDVAVVLEGVDFATAVSVRGGEGLGLEAKIVLLAPSTGQVVVGGSVLRLDVVEVGSVVPVASKLTFRTSDEFSLLLHLKVEGAGQLA